MFKKKRQVKKILVVDDDRSTVMFMSSILKRNGYDVITGSDGLECVEKAQSELPDLVLLDYMMPNMNGPTALAKIRASKKTADIPVIQLQLPVFTPCQAYRLCRITRKNTAGIGRNQITPTRQFTHRITCRIVAKTANITKSF